MAPRLTGLTKLTLETAPTVCHECIWWRRASATSTRTAGWRRSSWTSAPGAPSTTTPTAGCSVRCSTARRKRSRARRSCPAGRRPTTRSSSRARTSSSRRARGCCSRSSWRRSARRAIAVRASSRRSRIAIRRASRYERFRSTDGLPADLLGHFGFEAVRSAGRSASRAWSSAALRRSTKARARSARGRADAFGAEPVPAPPPDCRQSRVHHLHAASTKKRVDETLAREATSASSVSSPEPPLIGRPPISSTSGTSRQASDERSTVPRPSGRWWFVSGRGASNVHQAEARGEREQRLDQLRNRRG